LLLAGCATRTIYVPDGEPARLRETICDAKVWVMDAGGRAIVPRSNAANLGERNKRSEGKQARYERYDKRVVSQHLRKQASYFQTAVYVRL